MKRSTKDIWTQDDVIRDFFKRTKALQKNLNPVVEANLVYSGAVLDCAVLLANGWTETDEDGVFELEIKNKEFERERRQLEKADSKKNETSAKKAK